MTLSNCITKIHGKYYDLKKFKHPGGLDAIWHSYGRDATSMFEQYHPMVNQSMLYKILNKYKVSDENIAEAKTKLLKGEDNVPQFDFNSDFAIELKKEVKDYFLKKAKKESTTLRNITKASNSRWLLIFVLNFMRLICCIWWLSGSWIGLFLSSILSWVGGINTYHDACHFTLSKNWRINKFFGYFALEYYTPLIWYYEHNISHHSYTNISHKDVDIFESNPLLRLTPYTKHKWIHRFQIFTLFVISCLFNLGFEVRNIIRTINSEFYFRIVPKDTGNYNELLDKIIFLVYYSIRFIGLLFWFDNHKILFVFLPSVIQNLLYMINAVIIHLHEDNFNISKDWYAHQVQTATNHSIGYKLQYILSGGLNHQIEHHLFPGVNHCHYQDIQPIVQSICNKHNIKYNTCNGYFDAICSFCDHMLKLGKYKLN